VHKSLADAAPFARNRGRRLGGANRREESAALAGCLRRRARSARGRERTWRRTCAAPARRERAAKGTNRAARAPLRARESDGRAPAPDCAFGTRPARRRRAGQTRAAGGGAEHERRRAVLTRAHGSLAGGAWAPGRSRALGPEKRVRRPRLDPDPPPHPRDSVDFECESGDHGVVSRPMSDPGRCKTRSNSGNARK
jgi:hypothetical protein